jgi:16S rRNA (guanine966-N2)-methyltransferase
MRIIGGTAAGIILKVPKGFDVRPTPDLVRQALFNSLGQRVVGAKVLEVFAGTGALSLECLSRGATQAHCIEKSNKHAQFIRENLEAANFSPAQMQIRVQDAFVGITQLAAIAEKFDLILADPPYGEKNVGRRSVSFAQKMLDDESLPKLIAEDGLFILGHTKRDTLDFSGAWEEIKMLKHGDTVMRFLKLKST